MRAALAIVVTLTVGFMASACAVPTHGQTVVSQRLVAAARAALPATTAGLAVTSRVLGAPEAATVPAGTVQLRTRPIVGRWPRARVAVPVQIFVNGRLAGSETVWFAVNAMRTTWVYDRDTPAGTAVNKLHVHRATVDVAEADGVPAQSLAAVANDRLKRGIRAGWPVLKGDFESIPDVDKQSQVVVNVRYGSISMQAMATALDSGDVGDAVSVLVEGATTPVSATVAGKGVVNIAH